MRRELERIEIPGEHGARERSWAVVAAAYAGREPAPRRRSWKPVAAVALALVVVAGLLSPPGRAVLDGVRDAVGVESTPPLKLPADGKLLVVSVERGGVWIVRRDGSRRRLGAYEDATWSPFGRYLVATTRSRLVALDNDGRERWSLPARRPAWPRWGGSRTDTRIAYVAGSTLHVVAGNGRGDRPLAQGVNTPPAWRPSAGHVLAYTQPGALHVVDTETGRELWGRSRVEPAFSLLWSADGTRLATLSNVAVAIYDGSTGGLIRRLAFAKPSFPAGETPGFPVAAAFAPSGHDLALVVRSEQGGRRSRILLLRGASARGPTGIFLGAGVIGDVAWSPDGRWLLADWRGADQWVFLRMPRVGRALAVPGIAAQFPRADGKGPLLWLEGRWCCAP
ncbi:MAG: hypothetical protein ABIR67_14795 [Gaiellaceae bacterium]